MERKLCGMLIRAVAFWAAFSVRAGEPELSGYSGFCDGDIVKDAVVDFSGLSLHADQLLSYTNNIAVDRQGQKYGAKELTPDLGLNAYDFEARTLTPAFPMFIQQDPMAEKYYPLSPYLYCAGNPVNLVDPTGMDIYLLALDGNMTRIVKTNDDRDIIISTKLKVCYVPKSFFESGEKEGFTYHVPYINEDGGLSSYLDEGTCDYYRVTEMGEDLFAFFAENTNVEWSLVTSETQGSFVGNSHKEMADATLEIVLNNNPELKGTVVLFYHSHPTEDSASPNDVKLATQLESHSPNVKCKIYYPNTGNWSNYNSNTPTSGITEIQMLKDAVVEEEARPKGFY